MSLGWIADHAASSTATLAIAAVGSALSTIAFGLAEPGWPVWAFVLLAAVAGFSVSGWNGVQIAEVARRSPPEFDRRDRGRRGHPGVHEQHAGAGRFCRLCRADRPLDYAFLRPGRSASSACRCSTASTGRGKIQFFAGASM